MQVSIPFSWFNAATHRTPWCGKITCWPDTGPAVLSFGKTAPGQAGMVGTLDAEPGDVVCWGAKTIAGLSDPAVAGWAVVQAAAGSVAHVTKEKARYHRRLHHPEDATAAPVQYAPRKNGMRPGQKLPANVTGGASGPKTDWKAALAALAGSPALIAERDALRAHLAALMHAVEDPKGHTALSELLPAVRDLLAGKTPNAEHPDDARAALAAIRNAAPASAVAPAPAPEPEPEPEPAAAAPAIVLPEF